ncbi:tyrosine-type recombinase/integrase [Rudaea sp.]|uniref:tyrosine-type recombinase/integrase n=1 Tax=Rudaea sp. TaxID=2136325 RepID=UPI00321F819F
MTTSQIRAFYLALRAYRGYPETALCLRLISLTACRPGEAADAEWSEFDFEAKVWRRPAEKMKARRDHISPLSEQALKALEQLRPISAEGRYLFPHRSGEGFTTPNRLTYAMRDMNLGPRTSPPVALFSTAYAAEDTQDQSAQPGTDTWITTKVKAELMATKGIPAEVDGLRHASDGRSFPH